LNVKREPTRIAIKGTHWKNNSHLSSEANLYLLMRLLCYTVIFSVYYMKLLRWGHVIELDYFMKLIQWGHVSEKDLIALKSLEQFMHMSHA
jgi:hypothetical protein